jgi:hypothetical protein
MVEIKAVLEGRGFRPNFFGKSMDKSFLPLLYPVFPR